MSDLDEISLDASHSQTSMINNNSDEEMEIDQIPILKEQGALKFLKQIDDIRNSKIISDNESNINPEDDFEFISCNNNKEIDSRSDILSETELSNDCPSSQIQNHDIKDQNLSQNPKTIVSFSEIHSKFKKIENFDSIQKIRQLFHEALINTKNNSVNLFDLRKSKEFKIDEMNDESESLHKASDLQFRMSEFDVEKFVDHQKPNKLTNDDKFLLDYIVNARYIKKMNWNKKSDESQTYSAQYNDPNDTYRIENNKLITKDNKTNKISKKNRKKLEEQEIHRELEKKKIHEINDINKKILDINLSSGIINIFEYQSLLKDKKFMNHKNISKEYDHLVSIDFDDDITSDVEDYILKKIEESKPSKKLDDAAIITENDIDNTYFVSNDDYSRKMKRKQEKMAKKIAKKAKKLNHCQNQLDHTMNDNNIKSKLIHLKEIEQQQVKNSQKCIFKYKKVPKANFNLTDHEILNATDEELNKWCKISKVFDNVADDHVAYARRMMHYSKKDELMFKKRHIFKSIYGGQNSDPQNDQNETNNSVITKSRLKAYGL